MNLMHEGVLDPNEPDFRDERRELVEYRRKTASEVKLKPCPFCGKAARLQQGFMWLIGCDTRGCIGYRPYSLKRNYETAREAVSAWNRRANDE